MKTRNVVFAILAVLAALPACAQDRDALSRWAEESDKELVRFLPNASQWNMTVDPDPLFSGPANETYDYKGVNSIVTKYPSYVVHQDWWYNDPALAQEQSDLQREKSEFKQEEERKLQEFEQMHSAEMKAWDDDQKAKQNALVQQADPLLKQGKYEEAGKILKSFTPQPYAPFKELADSIDKKQKEMDERDRALQIRRRMVTFQIQTNRTPTTTAPAFHPAPLGTLAGHPFFRQVRGTLDMGGRKQTLVDLAVFVGPPGYVNPKVKIGERQLAVKSVVVWAMVQSLPNSIDADEAAARKVLESVDYNGLSALIQP